VEGPGTRIPSRCRDPRTDDLQRAACMLATLQPEVDKRIDQQSRSSEVRTTLYVDLTAGSNKK